MLPIIILTAHTDDDHFRRVKNVSSEGYIRKPFNDDDLRIDLKFAL